MSVVKILTFKFCCNLLQFEIFFRLLQFEFLSFVTIWVMSKCDCCQKWSFVTINFVEYCCHLSFEFCPILSCWVLKQLDLFVFYHSFSFVTMLINNFFVTCIGLKNMFIWYFLFFFLTIVLTNNLVYQKYLTGTKKLTQFFCHTFFLLIIFKIIFIVCGIFFCLV